jgi:N6-adenosine-specific RNA methylase IME4
MDPPLAETDKKPGQITFDEFASLEIPNLIKCGFLFIWTEKEYTHRMLNLTQKWGFRYVENFVWIKKNINNTIAEAPSKYFKKSKSTCLIFRNVILN